MIFFHPSRLRRWLAGASSPQTLPPSDAFRSQARRFTVAQVVTRAFYAFLLYTAIAQFSDLPHLLDRAAPAPPWPVVWLRHAGRLTGPRVLMAFYIVTNVLGAFTVAWRASRVLTFLGLLEFVALKESFGKIGHSLHLLLLVAGIFILLPAGWDRPAPLASRRRRQTTLLVFWLAQAAVLLSYTMSGVAKFAAGLFQLVTGQPNAFFPGGLSAIVAQRLLETHSTSFLGPWIVRHPFLTWPAFPAAIYLESFAFLAAFRPALARPWVALLILFHVSTYLTMTISFPQSCFLLAILFASSPFEPTLVPAWQTRLLALPCAHHLYKLWQTVRPAHGE